jgi:hypothetical protein
LLKTLKYLNSDSQINMEIGYSNNLIKNKIFLIHYEDYI